MTQTAHMRDSDDDAPLVRTKFAGGSSITVGGRFAAERSHHRRGLVVEVAPNVADATAVALPPPDFVDPVPPLLSYRRRPRERLRAVVRVVLPHVGTPLDLPSELVDATDHAGPDSVTLLLERLTDCALHVATSRIWAVHP